MPLFQSKPQYVEAVQWDGTKKTFEEILNMGAAATCKGELQLYAGKDKSQGLVPVPVGHWVVHIPQDVSDFWPVENDYFQNKYEAINL